MLSLSLFPVSRGLIVFKNYILVRNEQVFDHFRSLCDILIKLQYLIIYWIYQMAAIFTIFLHKQFSLNFIYIFKSLLL